MLVKDNQTDLGQTSRSIKSKSPAGKTIEICFFGDKSKDDHKESFSLFELKKDVFIPKNLEDYRRISKTLKDWEMDYLTSKKRGISDKEYQEWCTTNYESYQGPEINWGDLEDQLQLSKMFDNFVITDIEPRENKSVYSILDLFNERRHSHVMNQGKDERRRSISNGNEKKRNSGNSRRYLSTKNCVNAVGAKIQSPKNKQSGKQKKESVVIDKFSFGVDTNKLSIGAFNCFELANSNNDENDDKNIEKDSGDIDQSGDNILGKSFSSSCANKSLTTPEANEVQVHGQEQEAGGYEIYRTSIQNPRNSNISNILESKLQTNLREIEEDLDENYADKQSPLAPHPSNFNPAKFHLDKIQYYSEEANETNTDRYFEERQSTDRLYKSLDFYEWSQQIDSQATQRKKTFKNSESQTDKELILEQNQELEYEPVTTINITRNFMIAKTVSTPIRKRSKSSNIHNLDQKTTVKKKYPEKNQDSQQHNSPLKENLTPGDDIGKTPQEKDHHKCSIFTQSNSKYSENSESHKLPYNQTDSSNEVKPGRKSDPKDEIFKTISFKDKENSAKSAKLGDDSKNKNEDYLFAADSNWNQLQYSISNQKTVKTFKTYHSGVICTIAISPDKRFIFTGGADKHIRQYSIATQNLMKDYGEIHQDWIRSIKITPSQKFLFSAGDDCQLTQLNLKDFCIHKKYEKIHNEAITLTVLMPNEKYLLTSSIDRTLKQWIISSNGFCSQKKHYTKLHQNYTTSLEQAKDGKYLLSGGDDLKLKKWIFDENDELVLVMDFGAAHNSFVKFILPAILSENFFTWGNDRKLKKWELESGELVKDYGDITNGININNLVMSECGLYLFVSGNDNGVLQQFSIENMELVREYGEYHMDPIVGVIAICVGIC